MGSVVTTYDIMTRYTLQDHVSGGARRMSHELQAASAASGGLNSALRRVGAAILATFGAYQAKKALIEYNSYMEQARIQMAGMMAQAGSGDFVGNLAVASKLIRDMRDDSGKTVGTLKDYMLMASQLVQPLTMAGGKAADIREMTRLAVVGSRAMGIDAIVSARDVDQAIRGQYRSVDQFTGKLLTPMGFGGEAGRQKFNAMSMQERFATVKKGLQSKAIQDMAAAQEATFEGVYSTFETKMSELAGNLGTPLFKGLTAELAKWNDWLTKNEKLVEKIANDLGTKILQAAISFKDAIAWAAEHWKTIAASYGAMKAAGALSTFGKMSGAAEAAYASAGTVAQVQAAARSNKYASVGAALTVGTIVASAVYIGATELTKWIEGRQAGAMDVSGRVAGMGDLVARAKNDPAALQALRQMMMVQGLASAQGGFNADLTEQALRHNKAARMELGGALGIGSKSGFVGGQDSKELAEAMGRYFAAAVRDDYIKRGGMMQDLVKPWSMLDGIDLTPKDTGKKGDVKVTIQRIEVQSDDPDRFAFGLDELVQTAASRRGLTPGYTPPAWRGAY